MKVTTFGQCHDGDWKKPWAGFVYEVYDIKNNKYYIGKKNFFSKRTMPGKTNKTKVESDWSTYCTSNAYLKQAIKQDVANFQFRMIYLAKDDSILSYLENKEMMERGALESESFYNGDINMNIMATYADFNNRFLKI